MTWSPCFTWVTPGPTASTTPADSWPSTVGRRVRIRARHEVEVAVAQARRRGAHEHFAGTGLADDDFVDVEFARDCFENSSSHGPTLALSAYRARSLGVVTVASDPAFVALHLAARPRGDGHCGDRGRDRSRRGDGRRGDARAPRRTTCVTLRTGTLPGLGADAVRPRRGCAASRAPNSTVRGLRADRRRVVPAVPRTQPAAAAAVHRLAAVSARRQQDAAGTRTGTKTRTTTPKCSSRLAKVDSAAQPICDELADALARFGNYGRRLAAARARVEAGEHDWMTKPMIDSYHSVWFELHEDLLATLGIERGSEPNEVEEGA